MGTNLTCTLVTPGGRLPFLNWSRSFKHSFKRF